MLRCKRPAVQVVRDTSLRSRENMERTTEAAQNALGHLVNSFSVPPLSCIIIIITTRALQRKERERERVRLLCEHAGTDRLFRSRQVFHNELVSLREIFIYFSLSVSTFAFIPAISLTPGTKIDRRQVFSGKTAYLNGYQVTAKGFNRILVALFLLNSQRPPDRREIGHDAGSRSFSRISRIPATRDSAGNEETAALIFL